MSVYPQSRYTQVASPFPHSYHPPPPPPPQYQYAPPPPQPLYFADPNAFRRDYSSRLAELTVNSRPIIQSLSMLAQDYSRWADIIAQCIESHIRRVPPWMKLPAFYLLDAVSKNVFEPYARNFSPLVVPLFLETYGQVDQNTRNKMEEMLLTWRTGAPTGRELFGVVAQLAIEQGIWGGGSTSSQDQSNISKSQVLSELEFTVSQKERALQVNPYDTLASTQLSVLYQLRKLVEAGVMQDELRQILGQLRALSRTSASPPAPASQALNTHNTNSAGPSALLPSNSYPQAQTNYATPSASYSASQSYTYPQADVRPSTVVPSLTAPQSMASSSATRPSGLPVSNIATLFSSLVKAGVVSATPPPPVANIKSEPQPYDPLREGIRDYRRTLMSQKIKLSSSEITRTRSQIVDLLYGRLKSQCKQCGMRFHDSPVGKKKMEDHLDMHFRQNRKASQNSGRGHNRSWFTALDDWIHDASDVKGKNRADRQSTSKAAAAEELAKREAELRALYVVVPPGDEAKPISCPVCKELFKSEFLEDDEEWVWNNAIKKDDRIYHATCHAEAVSSTNNLAARLRNEIESRSRSETPEAPLSRSTPPKVALNSSVRTSLSPSPASKVAGSKRKADNLSESDKPPLKKLELSS